MNYTVVWTPAAENQLAAVWVASARQRAVTRAVEILDTRLAAGGPAVGESRSHGRRIAIEAPIGVIFEVDENTRTVRVGRVWEYG